MSTTGSDSNRYVLSKGGTVSDKLLADLHGAIWTVSSFHKHASSHGQDEMIVEITRKPGRWARWWGAKETSYKVVFTGRSFEWFEQPRYVPVTDTTMKYRLYDLWFEATRPALFR